MMQPGEPITITADRLIAVREGARVIVDGKELPDVEEVIIYTNPLDIQLVNRATCKQKVVTATVRNGA